MVIIIGLLFGIQSATLIHMVPRATDIGIDLVAAAFIASVCAGTGVAGKLAFGTMVDRMPVRLAFWIAVACQIVGQAVMFLTSDYLPFFIGAAIFGFGMGGIVPMQGAVVGAAFGRASFGQVLGVMHLLMAFIHLAVVIESKRRQRSEGDYQVSSFSWTGPKLSGYLPSIPS